MSILTRAGATGIAQMINVTPVAAQLPPPVEVAKPTYLIVGDSGTGKTSAFRNMDWDNVCFIDTERKGMSWDSLEYPMPTDYHICANHTDVEKVIAKTKKSIVVLDSLTKYIEFVDVYCNNAYNGHDVWAQYSRILREFFEKMKSTTRTFIATAIPEVITLNGSDGGAAESLRRVSSRGKVWEGKIEKEFAFVFCTVYKTDMKAATPTTKFYFQTSSYGLNRAKTPMGVFKDMYIDNDMAAVLRLMAEREARVAAESPVSVGTAPAV